MLKVSCFSYKGGSGRTTLIYNTIPFLVKKLGANNKHPILLVDLDVDSAGLTYILDNDVVKNKNTSKLTSNELIDDNNASELNRLRMLSKNAEKTIDEWDIYNRFTPVGFRFGLDSSEFNANNAVLFVPASPNDTKIHFDMGSNTCIKDFIQFAKNVGCSAVIFDLPAGEQIAGKQALQYSDLILVCFRITKQHREGTFDYLARNVIAGGTQKFVLVPNAVPDTRKKIFIDGKTFNFDAVRESALKTFEEIFKNKGMEDSQLITNMFEGEWYGVPEVGRFKLMEGIIFKIKNSLPSDGALSEDEEFAYQAYDKLTSIMVDNNHD